MILFTLALTQFCSFKTSNHVDTKYIVGIIVLLPGILMGMFQVVQTVHRVLTEIQILNTPYTQRSLHCSCLVENTLYTYNINYTDNKNMTIKLLYLIAGMIKFLRENKKPNGHYIEENESKLNSQVRGINFLKANNFVL